VVMAAVMLICHGHVLTNQGFLRFLVENEI